MHSLLQSWLALCFSLSVPTVFFFKKKIVICSFCFSVHFPAHCFFHFIGWTFVLWLGNHMKWCFSPISWRNISPIYHWSPWLLSWCIQPSSTAYRTILLYAYLPAQARLRTSILTAGMNPTLVIIISFFLCCKFPSCKQFQIIIFIRKQCSKLLYSFRTVLSPTRPPSKVFCTQLHICEFMFRLLAQHISNATPDHEAFSCTSWPHSYTSWSYLKSCNRRLQNWWYKEHTEQRACVCSATSRSTTTAGSRDGQF